MQTNLDVGRKKVFTFLMKKPHSKVRILMQLLE